MILWLMDPLEKLKVEKDSTLFLAALAAQEGQKNLFTHEIYLEDSVLKCEAYEIDLEITETIFPGNLLKSRNPAKTLLLADVDLVMNRREPPVDESYLLQCQLLTLHPRVCNSPVALQAYSEKLLPLLFHSGIPSSLGIAAAPTDGVIKPMNVFGGSGVEKVSQGSAIKKQHMFQPFRAAIARGENRYFILGEKVFGEVLKTPSAHDFRSNSLHGSTLSYSSPDKTLLSKTQELAPKLNALGIRLAVVDYIDNEIIEINITCPSLWNFLYKNISDNERKTFRAALKSLLEKH